jgi:hypothetical protein
MVKVSSDSGSDEEEEEEDADMLFVVAVCRH